MDIGDGLQITLANLAIVIVQDLITLAQPAQLDHLTIVIHVIQVPFYT